MRKEITVSLGPAARLTENVALNAVSLGKLYFDYVRNEEISSFSYSNAWLQAGNNWLFDPDIHFFAGRQYPASGKSLFGMMTDSCPDRWGRTLLQRHEAIKAKQEQRPPRVLSESDYLLGVNDISRMGALRFSPGESGKFLSTKKNHSVPPKARLRTLEHAAHTLEKDDATPDQIDADLSLLLDPGSSLGGARPKASIEDVNGDLWIAKFPSQSDIFDVGLAEFLVYEMAKDFGIAVSKSSVDKYSDRGHTFLIKRFDREGSLRIHFSSMMNLLGKLDGEGSTSGVSYLDLIALLREIGSTPREDLIELFKRVLFSVAVSNTDDHLRNHGCLLSTTGWRLSPLFDVNPNPQGRGLSLNISEHDNSLSFELVCSQATYFGLSKSLADSLTDEVISLMSTWEQRAKKLGMDRNSIEVLRPAFTV